MAIEVPDRFGRVNSVVLGFAGEAEHQQDHPYLGALVGRHSGRIGRAQFTLYDVDYQLSASNGRNGLAGGFSGFDMADWAVVMAADGR